MLVPIRSVTTDPDVKPLPLMVSHCLTALATGRDGLMLDITGARGTWTKLPVIALLLVIVTVMGFWGPVRSPVHSKNFQPEAAVAVKVTCVPWL